MLPAVLQSGVIVLRKRAEQDANALVYRKAGLSSHNMVILVVQPELGLNFKILYFMKIPSAIPVTCPDVRTTTRHWSSEPDAYVRSGFHVLCA
jgi:hypothetical protein